MIGDNDYFAGLSKLTLSAGSLEPEFARNTYLYTASVANRVDTLTVTAMPESRTEEWPASVVITPADADPNMDGHQVALAVGKTTIRVGVNDGYRTTRTYEIIITRRETVLLSALKISDENSNTIEFRQPFLPTTFEYGAIVSSGTDTLIRHRHGRRRGVGCCHHARRRQY